MFRIRLRQCLTSDTSKCTSAWFRRIQTSQNAGYHAERIIAQGTFGQVEGRRFTKMLRIR